MAAKILVFISCWIIFVTPVYAQGTAKISDILIVIQKIIGFLAPTATLLFFIMTIYGGFKFVRSRGEPKNVEEARNILQYALIGAVLVAGSWLLLKFVSDITGCDVTVLSFSNC